MSILFSYYFINRLMAMPAETLLSGVPLSALAAEATPPEIIIPEREPMPSLVRYGRGINLLIDTSGFAECHVSGRGYENVCFAHTVAELEADQFAFGPGIIDTAMQRIHRPDALIFKLTPSGLLLEKLTEYRLGDCTAGKKLRGFLEFTQALRDNPDRFSEALGETIGDWPLIPITVPADEEIKVEFINPRLNATNGYGQVKDFPFPVRYSRVKNPHGTYHAA